MYTNQTATSLTRQEQLRGHLPSWQRPSLTDHVRRGGKIRQLHRNEAILPPKNGYGRTVSLMEPGSDTMANGQERISILERRLEFLISQHTDTLTHLHKELDNLKTENKELNFQLVMCRCGMNSRSTTISRSQSRQLQRKSTPMLKPISTEQDGYQIILEERLQSLKDSVQKEKKHNSRLMRVVEKMMQRSLGNPTDSILMNNNDYSQLSNEQYKQIIERLLLLNRQQDQQIIQLKQDLRGVLTEEIPKTFTSTETIDTHSQKTVLPSIPIIQDRSTVTNEISFGTVHLPVLKPRAPPPQRYNRKPVQLQRNRLTTFPPHRL